MPGITLGKLLTVNKNAGVFQRTLFFDQSAVNEAKPRPHSMIYSQQELNQASHGVYQSTQHPQLYYRHSQPPTESVPARNHPWDASHESLSPPTGSHLQIYPGGPTFNEEMTGSSPELANPIFPVSVAVFYLFFFNVKKYNIKIVFLMKVFYLFLSMFVKCFIYFLNNALKTFTLLV